MTALTASTACALLSAVALHQWHPAAVQAATFAGAPAPAGSSAPLDPRIAAIAATRPSQSVEAIVQFKGGVGLERARWDVTRLQGRVVGELHIINALAVKLTAAQARSLASSGDVHAVSLNAAVKTVGGPDGPGGHKHHHGSIDTKDLLTTYNQTLNATSLWQAGFDGSGVGVAVVDTGIAGNLPDFQAPGQQSRVVGSVVTNPYAANARDGYGHGTDVAGIIAGNGNSLSPDDPLRGKFIGVAPGANLVSVKVSDEAGNATVLDVIYGLQFAIDHQSDYDIRVVNLSLDSQTPQSYKTDPLDAAAEAAWMHGIVVVAAAGNRGSGGDAVQYAPANDPYVITVGAVDENGSASATNDSVPSWSSQGTTQDGFQKPDVYAPGAHIVSVLAPGSVFAGLCNACQIGGEYVRASGTSMATPMISGLVADLLQAHPSWTPNQVKGALTSPAVASNSALQEVDAAKVLALDSPPEADSGLTPNQLIEGTTGNIDYSRSSWSRSSWSTAIGPLSAGFARSSWSCTCSTASAGGIDPTRSSWSRSSWSTHFDPTPTNG
jgi:serine protease AprX